MDCPSLSRLINVGLKSTLPEISIAAPACFQGPFAWYIFFQPFTLNQCLFLSMSWVSCKQQLVGIFFFNPVCQSVSFDGEFSPLTFSVGIDRYVVIPAI
jgi:hypothetical protein